MADIVEITFSIKKNDYPCQTFVSHSVSAQVDSVSAFTCDVTERYTDHAMKLCRSIARTMEKDKALHKSIGAEPCCERFANEHSTVSREALFCPFCAEEITEERRAKYIPKKDNMEDF